MKTNNNITNEIAKDELKQAISDEIQLVNPQKTEEYKNKWSIRRPNGQAYNLLVDPEVLSKYGIGLSLFFDFIKQSIFIFIAMSLISIPILISNYSGDGLSKDFQKDNNFLTKMTIAN